LQYELKSGDEVVATLKFRNLMGTLAVAEGLGGCWNFKRVGFWQSDATVRACDSDTNIATFKRNIWKNAGSLILPDNRELRVTGNVWLTQLEIQKATGECLMRLKVQGLTQTSAEVEILPAAEDFPETSWLIMFCWYLVVSMQMNAGG
jgi:hypothetical protein